MIRFEEARERVISEAQRLDTVRPTVIRNLPEALHHILAESILTDRDYPPFHRSTRDGYAVRSVDARPTAQLRCVGEIKAGDAVSAPLAPGTCLQIMTGAAVPPEADAVVMIEFTARSGEVVTFQRETVPGQAIVPRASEAHSGDIALETGCRLGYAELAIAAQVGASQLVCYKKPRVAILSTGDEIVPVVDTPGPFQIRNTNSVSLSAQVQLAGGEPIVLGKAQDRVDDLSTKIELGLHEDLLILSGGVSMGKYDLVESVLKTLGTEFFFDAVAIRPGKPTVFGRCRNTLVFGIPGNPVSTMVTFQLFATAAIDILGGAAPRPIPMLQAVVREPLHERPPLAHFIPACIEWPNGLPEVRPLRWQGSGDISALRRANCFLYIPADHLDITTGELVSVLPRFDVF